MTENTARHPPSRWRIAALICAFALVLHLAADYGIYREANGMLQFGSHQSAFQITWSFGHEPEAPPMQRSDITPPESYSQIADALAVPQRKPKVR